MYRYEAQRNFARNRIFKAVSSFQGSEQLGCKLYNTRKWIGATEVVTLLSSLRINCQLIDFHRPTTPDGKHPELFNWVLRYFEQQKQQPPLYLQHQGNFKRHCLAYFEFFLLVFGSFYRPFPDNNRYRTSYVEFNATGARSKPWM